jgi:site-specific recombinase XerD
MRSRSDLSPNTIRGYVRHIKVFLNWLYDTEYIKSNISKRIPVMKGVEKQIIILDDDEITTIIYSVKGTTERAWRKRAIIYIMLAAASG